MSKKRSLKDIARIFTGFSTPIFGVDWNPPIDEREIVRSLLTYLEDKRSLYYPEYCEFFPWVTESIIEIRKELTTTLQKAPENSAMVDPIKIMRSACRKFLDESHVKAGATYSLHDIQVWTSLGELRGVFGICIARLCSAYGIDASDELARLFPKVE